MSAAARARAKAFFFPALTFAPAVATFFFPRFVVCCLVSLGLRATLRGAPSLDTVPDSLRM